MIRTTKTTQRLLIGSGVLLWSLMAFVLLQKGGAALRTQLTVGQIIPMTRAANPAYTTCGTYTTPDRGVTPPFVEQGDQTPGCATAATGLNICINGAYPSCFCQQGSGGNCGNLGSCSGNPNVQCANNGDCSAVGAGTCVAATFPVPPTAPLAIPVQNGQYWDIYFRWWTNYYTNDNCIYFNEKTTPDTWKCIWGDPNGGPLPTCSIQTVCEANKNYFHEVMYPLLPNGKDYFSAIKSADSFGHEIHSEIRTFHSYISNFTISVTPPADTKIVTGEQTDPYTVTVTPVGGATGNVTLSLDNWAPAINGINVTWPSGSTVDLSNPQPKTFRIQTDDGTPPTWPPVTRDGIYSFRVKGTHGTMGDRFFDMTNGLTVMDYQLTNSSPPINLPGTGGNANFLVTPNWLPAGWMYDGDVTLTSSAIPGLTVTFDQYSPPLNKDDATFRVNLTTNGVPQNSYTLDIFGNQVAGLQRKTSVIINIAGSPDFALGVDSSSMTITQGNNGSNGVTVSSSNGFSEPVALDGTVIQQGHVNPEPTIGLIFTPQQPHPPAGGSDHSSLQVTTTGATPCNTTPGERYDITIQGSDNVIIGPPDTTHTVHINPLFVVCAAQQGFVMSVQPNPQTVNQGDVATYHVTITSQNGFNDQVDMTSLVTCPPGTTCTYPQTVNVTPSTPGTFDFVADTDTNTPAGQYPMVLSAQAHGNGSITGSVTMTLNVNPAADYLFSVTPSPLNIPVGQNAPYTVSVTGSNGFSTPIKFSWTMNPANPSVGFNPTSGNLTVTPGNSGTITVSAGALSAGSYLLDFTGVPQGPGTTKYANGIQLIIGTAICNGKCENVCVDNNNIPLVPEVICHADGDCPGAGRCSPQTCRGADGCVPDPVPGPFDCNKDLCYNPGGGFIIPAAAPDCFQSWPRCKKYDVLKVRKDRQCDQWLSCASAVMFEDPVSKKTTTQCQQLGVCYQLGTDGECSAWLAVQPKKNDTYLSPLQVGGDASLIRWFSGYSTSFHFTGLTKSVCSGAQTVTCTSDPDCVIGGADKGPCMLGQQVIESTYPSQVVQETGTDGSASSTEDFVANGTFEELRCYGGSRDGLPCILPSDCRVGEGICTNAQTGTPGLFSTTPCTNDINCKGATAPNGTDATLFCRYLRTESSEITCRNPLDASWLGIVPVGTASEAGFSYNESDQSQYDSDVLRGQKRGADNEIAVQFSVREDDANFTSIASKIPAGDPRHPIYAREDHLKDGNNYLRVTVSDKAVNEKVCSNDIAHACTTDAECSPGACIGNSGAGVSLPSQFSVSSNKFYTLSFKIRAEEGSTADAQVQAQLGFDYVRVSDARICAQDHAHACVTNPDCIYDGEDHGPCVPNDTQTNYEKTDNKVAIFGDVTPTSDWQTIVLGPISPPDGAHQGATTFLNFVSTNAEQKQVVFDIDDVSLKPVLALADSHICSGGQNDGKQCMADSDCPGGSCVPSTTPTDALKLERRCRVYPRDDSPGCDYRDAQMTRYRGWKGYCLDKDPQNPDLCLTWWPLDLLSGETIIGSQSKVGYNDRAPLYFCMQAQGGDHAAEFYDNHNSGGEQMGYVWNNVGMLNVPPGFSDSYGMRGGPLPVMRWADVDRIEFNVDLQPDNAHHWEWVPDAAHSKNVIVEQAPGGDRNLFTAQLLQDISTSAGINYWSYGGYAYDDSSYNHMMQFYGDPSDRHCEHNDRWVRFFAIMSHPENADLPDANLVFVHVYFCGNGQVSFQGIDFKMIVKSRQSCNVYSQVVEANNNNKAWWTRVRQGSSYVLGDLGYGYFSDLAPFGAALGDPSSWQTDWGNGQLTTFSSIEPPSTDAPHAGTPLTCLGDCSQNKKYCFSAKMSDPCDNANCDTGIGNRCQNAQEITNCQNNYQGNGNLGICVGRPLGRCTGNLTIACSSNPDCGTQGTCATGSDGSNRDLSYAADHLKRLFAQSYNCLQLHAEPLATQRNGQAVTTLHYSYIPCQVGNQISWNVSNYCAGDRPGTWPAAYCMERPKIKANSFVINNQINGIIPVTPQTNMSGGFSYSVNQDQEPMRLIGIVWDYNAGDPVAACTTASNNWPTNLTENGKFKETFHYTELNRGHDYHPIACVRDNWEAWVALPFTGTVHVQ